MITTPKCMDVSIDKLKELHWPEVAELCQSWPPLVDVHCHLTHQDFDEDRHELIAALPKYGLGGIVVNGLEPMSNRQVLELAARYPFIYPAVGIYPLEAVHDRIPEHHPLKPSLSFCVNTEVGWIEDQAHQGRLAAVGECGLDGYHFAEELLPPQETVLTRLALIAQKYNLPLIVHSRKCERRIMELLAGLKITEVVFHCYMGKVKHALQGAHDHGWYFSIPAIAPRHQGFQRMLMELPAEQILTETDSPYLSQIRGLRNDPRQVVYGLATLARLRKLTMAAAAQLVWANFQRLFTHA